MKQEMIIDALARWLGDEFHKPLLAILQDHVGEKRQHAPLYIREKLPKQGRRKQIKQVDVAAVDESAKTVRLIIEIDPDANPAHILGAVGAALVADIYVPTSKHSSSDAYEIEDCVMLYATTVSGKPNSQKPQQLEVLEETINSKLVLANRSCRIRRVYIRHAWDENQLIEECQRVIREELGTDGRAKPN